MDIIQVLSDELQVRADYVGRIINLIDAGNTIPFIARYRKEMTGSCDDQVLRKLADRLAYLRNLEKRKQEIADSITSQEKMTEEIGLAIAGAMTLAEAEDIYRPFRPKRRTRATAAKEKGLEGLARTFFDQAVCEGSLSALAASYVDPEKGVSTWEEAVAGALDIIAEGISDDAQSRKRIRALAMRDGILTSISDHEEDSVYRMYYDYSERVAKIPGHRILAVNRGEREGFLKVKVDLNADAFVSVLSDKFVRPGSVTTESVDAAVQDAWKRLIAPSVEREVRSALTERAENQAIAMFAVNLKPLLLQPPVRNKIVLGVDPAYRTGCKIAVVDQTGKVLETAVIYPTPPQNKIAEAKSALKRLIEHHKVTAISIGNGTASKEAELFIAELISEIDVPLAYMIVSEAGASVYSASRLAAEEFPDFDVSLRSAVSIARRLQDPLAELVKIDPKSIGVGQYQHDMPQTRLDSALGGVVEDCVNSVGVDLNTASPSLLTHIAGLSAAVAKNIVAYREENGRFESRSKLKKVPKLGPKAFEQCAGFLRIPGGKNILDNTSVHPESYDAAEKLLALFSLTLADVATEAGTLPLHVRAYGEERAAEAVGIGVLTFRDIVAELMKPGRDIRDELPPPLLRTDVMKLSDLMEGMVLRGTVRNVTDFGAFVDIGVHEDGLVHISELSNRYVRHPSEVVKVGDVVDVTVLRVEEEKKRISLSMKNRQEKQ